MSTLTHPDNGALRYRHPVWSRSHYERLLGRQFLYVAVHAASLVIASSECELSAQAIGYMGYRHLGAVALLPLVNRVHSAPEGLLLHIHVCLPGQDDLWLELSAIVHNHRGVEVMLIPKMVQPALAFNATKEADVFSVRLVRYRLPRKIVTNAF